MYGFGRKAWEAVAYRAGGIGAKGAAHRATEGMDTGCSDVAEDEEGEDSVVEQGRVSAMVDQH